MISTNSAGPQGGFFRTAAARILLIVVLAVGAASLWHHFNGVPEGGQGVIELSDMQLHLSQTGLNLHLAARVRLAPAVEAGLNSGIPLTFLIDLDVVRSRRWWLDKSVLAFQRRYTLTHYDLTRHYRVDSVDTGESRNYRSLSSALSGLGEMVHISAELDTEQRVLLSQQGLFASVNMQLSRAALPLPLQPIIRSSWTLVSEEYRWPII